MTQNLFDLTYQLAIELGTVYEGLATGGSTTTVVDTLRRTESDDTWNGGTLWVTYDAAGAGAAPQGEYARVTDFVNSTATLTVETVTAVASGDRYALTDKKYPLEDLQMAVNRAIRDIGPVPVTNSTAIDTATAQTEYTLPTAANDDLREVWLQWITNDANDNQWYPVRNWYLQRTAAGTADTLVFPEQPMYPRDVKLVYMAPHAALVASTDKLAETINYKRVIYRATVHALNHYRMKTHSTDEYLQQTIQNAERRADQADLMYPVKAPKKLGRMMRVSAAEAVELAPGENKIP
ncbi:MAG: hypothetical protein ACXABF_14050 [Candidatus Thorarchaeota archaeon]|jgi:hypothetical protein